MFSATRKKFVEGVESDYPDEGMYYSQPLPFSHRSDKDLSALSARSHVPSTAPFELEMLSSPSPSSSGQLSQLGASLYGPQSALGFSIRGMGNNTQLNRSLTQGTQLPSHITPTTGVPTMSLHTPPSPSRGILPMNSRNMLNHSQVGQGIGMVSSRTNSMGSSGLGSPIRSSPSIICMPKQQPARQPFTINSMSGFGMNRNQAFGMNNSLSSNIFNGTDGSENVTGLDLSDFPALADRSRREGSGNPTPLLNPLAGRAPYVGMVTKPSNEPTQDFSIHNEDFPALPGPNYKDPTLSNDDSKTNLNSTGKSTSIADGPMFPGDKTTSAQNNNQKKGIQVLPDGRVTNIPRGMVTDQFGMIGLLTFIRAAETDPGMVHLALGSDLTTLGLNLNSPENLYPKFASPWASAPCRPQDIDFHVPSEYLTNIHIRDKLAAIKLARYGEDLLFYLYYMNGGDLLQLLAAVELFNRDWRYHKEERVWITRAPGMEPTLKTNTYERGTYYFFDCLNWRKVAKEFHLEYDKLEERPHVPSTFNYNPAQQAF
ncbi:CCR4-NOT transcription complex subunit 2-like isoform 10-T13 [Salvelinus alpinus]|uniref:CCR4-NOT transcription complex subunit 2 isoform X8 n=1 Tax=Salvelinus sp. IW2-2015 TaxID=2691554 RepID=UPI000CDF7A82|nr:CCR4-NOT transcription complex subunit 2 isoform X6 [Salvelinus alpinus]XP_055770573.1 CCR4-NOT transcription complex subunit 2-like isoform X8 [Salvelinus fontinalis]